jgi:hypothetical protein
MKRRIDPLVNMYMWSSVEIARVFGNCSRKKGLLLYIRGDRGFTCNPCAKTIGSILSVTPVILVQ